jgi:hypothetical protein
MLNIPYMEHMGFWNKPSFSWFFNVFSASQGPIRCVSQELEPAFAPVDGDAFAPATDSDTEEESVALDGIPLRYPLVMTNIAIENGHL